MSKSNWYVVLDMAGKTYKANNKTIMGAFDDFELKWHKVKNKGVVKIYRKKGGKLLCEQLFTTPILKRIYANKLTKQMWAKRLKYLATAKEGEL